MNSNSGMSKVIPGLYVGNYRDSKDVLQLTRHEITHIIAIHDTARKLFANREYLLITASDVPSQNLVQYFQECNDFIHSARLKGGNVLVHCLAGMSRSVTVAVAYIMSVTNLGWQESIRAVRGARPIANPNEGFQRQLRDFQSLKLSVERRRLLDKFGNTGRDLTGDDETLCRRLVHLYKNSKHNNICDGQCVLASRCPTGICRAKSKLFRRKYSRTSVQSASLTVKLQRATIATRSDSIWSVSSLPSELLSNRTGHGSREQIFSEKTSSSPSPTLTPGASAVATTSAVKHCLRKRRFSEPNFRRHPETSSLSRSMSTPTSLIFFSIVGITVKSPSTTSLPTDLMKYRALPEITHAYETEDGIDPLALSEKRFRRPSLARSCVTHISNFSSSNIARISRSLRAMWNIGK